MAHLVTLDLGDHSFAQSPGLIADLAEAEAQMIAAESVPSGRSLGGGLHKADFRQHAQGLFDGVVLSGNAEPTRRIGHWLLGTVYGRDVLKQLLKRQHSDQVVSQWRYQPELDDQLETLIDALGMRDLAEPHTLSERLAYFSMMSQLLLSDGIENVACSA